MVRQWDAVLNELGIPSLKDLIYKDDAATGKRWHTTAKDVIEKMIWKELKASTEANKSIHWLEKLSLNENKFEPPFKFWPANRYSVAQKHATLTRLKLLTGHSWIASSMVRRHQEAEMRCPLCLKATETMEHMMFECEKLTEERNEAQEKYQVEIKRELPAEVFIANANTNEGLLIHVIYSARVQKEIMMLNN